MVSVLLKQSLASGLMVLAQASIDPELHQRCVEARDYAGCIEMQQRLQTPQESTQLNACPAGHAYSGAGIAPE